MLLTRLGCFDFYASDRNLLLSRALQIQFYSPVSHVSLCFVWNEDPRFRSFCVLVIGNPPGSVLVILKRVNWCLKRF